MTDSLSSLRGAFDTLELDEDSTVFSISARPVHASKHYADYCFIALLGLAQRLKVKVLPIMWQTRLGQVGSGGQAGINQSLLNIETSLAFKLFDRPQQHPLRAIAQEMVVLSHPVVRNHNHVIALEGICWDITDDDEVWPVLVFPKSHLGDLKDFSKREVFQNLPIEDKLKLCTDVGIAIRDMHCNGIIHGDIKPQNVLIFEENFRFVARVADFGFATCFEPHNSLIIIPGKGPWDAPEYHARPFRPEQAKQMDVYSFGLLCYWLIFEANFSDDIALRRDTSPQRDHAVNVSRCQPERDLLRLWKKDNQLIGWICRRVGASSAFDNSMKGRLVSLFRLTLALNPTERCLDFGRLIQLLTPWRDPPDTVSFQIDSVPEQEYFQIPPAVAEFYAMDFRLRQIIVKDLEYIIHAIAKPIVQHVSLTNAVLQLALCYVLGFGTTKTQASATDLLKSFSLENVNYQDHLDHINDTVALQYLNDSLSSKLTEQGHLRLFDFPSYYREKKLLPRAEVAYKQEISRLQLLFGKDHWLSMAGMQTLAWILKGQGRLSEAEELEVHITATRKRVFGEENLDTAISMANLASTYSSQGLFDKAEELERAVIGIGLKVGGEEHPFTLTAVANLASTFIDQGQWEEAKMLLQRVGTIRKNTLGNEHPDTILTAHNVAGVLWNQGQWKEAEELEACVLEIGERVLGKKSPLVLQCVNSLALIYYSQGRLVEAEKKAREAAEMSEKALGKEHPDTLSNMGNRAAILWDLQRPEEAEELSIQVIEVGTRVLGEGHPDILSRKHNLGSALAEQGRYTEAESLLSQVVESRKAVLGEEHPHTLHSMHNIAATFQNQQRLEEAEALFLEVLEKRKRVLGGDHPHTLETMHFLAELRHV